MAFHRNQIWHLFLYNIYTYDQPATTARKFACEDDVNSACYKEMVDVGMDSRSGQSNIILILTKMELEAQYNCNSVDDLRLNNRFKHLSLIYDTFLRSG